MFDKYCEICGIRVEKGRDMVRFGKHFCSQEHAEQYVNRRQERLSEVDRQGHRGGCC